MSNRLLTALTLGCAALGFLFLIAAARAEGAPSSCVPLSDAEHEIAASGGGKLKPLSHDQLQFARGLFVASPPVSKYPSGDDAMIAMFDDGAGAIVFTEGGMACGKMALSPNVTDLLIDLDKSI